jgi:hypothetical protein
MLGGAGESSFGIGYAADNDSVDLPKKKKTRTQRYVYARRDTEDGPLEIITPQESLWYRFYVWRGRSRVLIPPDVLFA